MIRLKRMNKVGYALNGMGNGGRRGVALVLAITMVALLMTFLIAAQTSVMGSLRLIARSNERMSESRMTDQALARAHQALNSTTQDSGELEVGGQDAPPVIVNYERLAPGNEIFDSLAGIEAYRDGDALVRVALDEATTPHQYLINVQSRRSGAIRIQ